MLFCRALKSGLKIFFFMILLSHTSHAVESIYTVQTGSFSELAQAEKQFNLIQQSLQDPEFDFLRIEKIGKFYSVRLGKFKGTTPANTLLALVKPRMESAITMKAYYKEERIIKLHRSSSAPGSIPETTQKESKKVRVRPEKTKPVMLEKAPPTIIKKRKLAPLEDQIRKISVMVEKRDYQGALKLLEAEIETRPENHRINAWYGVVLLKMNSPTRALPYFLKAAKLSPGRSDYHNSAGYCLYYLNRFDEALDRFQKAISLEPEHIDAFTGLGLTYAKTGKKGDAMDVYRKLSGLDKRSADKLLKIIKKTPF